MVLIWGWGCIRITVNIGSHTSVSMHVIVITVKIVAVIFAVTTAVGLHFKRQSPASLERPNFDSKHCSMASCEAASQGLYCTPRPEFVACWPQCIYSVYAYVCMYLCMYVCLYVCLYVYIYICTYTHVYMYICNIYMYECMCVYTCICACMYLCVYIYISLSNYQYHSKV